jgi:HAD superfamily hydrolase (TIGR01549 family)
MKTLIFDFDGTIANSFALVMDIAYKITGTPPQSDREIARLRKLPFTKVVRELGVPLYQVPRLLIQGRQKMLERIDEVHPFDGVPEVLKELHDAGYHLLVTSSNSEKNVRVFLRANKLEAYFDGVYGNASVFNKASSLRKVMRRNKLDVADCFYIGDEVRDIVAATRVNMDVVAVAWGYQAPESLKKNDPYALVYKPEELAHIFNAEKE